MYITSRWSIVAAILVVLQAVHTQINYGEDDQVLGGRIERNCFFSPMGCMVLPGRKFARVRRLPEAMKFWLI